jgi:hypothetical protein
VGPRTGIGVVKKRKMSPSPAVQPVAVLVASSWPEEVFQMNGIHIFITKGDLKFSEDLGLLICEAV